MKISKIILLLFVSLFVLAKPAFAIECGSVDVSGLSTGELPDFIKNCQEKITSLQSTINTYKTTIAVLNSKIQLAEAQIKQTAIQIEKLEQEIGSLSTVVSDLGVSLDELAAVYVARARESYLRRNQNSMVLLLSSDSFAKFLSAARYLSIIKSRDQRMLSEIDSARANFESQKNLKVVKQKEVQDLKEKLVGQQANLLTQQKSKQNLLAITQNDEARFQKLLREAQEELDALRLSTFTGKKEVHKGDVIGLMGSTGNSTGPHLHFGYYDMSEAQGVDLFKNDTLLWYFTLSLNPAEILARRSLFFYAKSCDDVSANGNREIGNGGSPWPMENPVITQCFGHTPYSFSYNSPKNGPFHDGLDMADVNNKSVRAVDDGVAYFYRGSNAFGNNVRIFHNNGKMTLYLHLQ